MDEPVRGRLRPARRRGLTCPDPVTAPARPPRPPVPVPQPNTGQAAEQGQRQESHARKPSRSFIRRPEQHDRHQNFGGGLRLSLRSRLGFRRSRGCGRGERRSRPARMSVQVAGLLVPVSDRRWLPVALAYGWSVCGRPCAPKKLSSRMLTLERSALRREPVARASVVCCDSPMAQHLSEWFRRSSFSSASRDPASKAAALGIVSWAKGPGVVDAALLRDGPV